MMKSILFSLLLLGFVFGHATIDQLIQKHYVHTEDIQQESEPTFGEAHRCIHDDVIHHLLKQPDAIGQAFDKWDHHQPRQATIGPIRFKWVTTYFDSDTRACTSVGQVVKIATNNQDFTCTADDVVTPEVKNFINGRMIPAISDVLSSFLSVPSLNNLVLNAPGTCTTDVTIPNELLTTGSPNTDYIVLATIRPTASSSTVAYAGPCKFLSGTGRPVAGFVNFNPRFFNDLAKGSSSFKFAGTVKIGVHEMTHAMGFTASLYDTYRNANGQTYSPTGTVTVSGTSAAGNAFNEQLTVMKSPAVLQAIRDHYNCPTLPGALLEDFGGQGTAGSHWEQRVAGDEFMTGYVNPSMPVSALTLALFQDMGWYTVNFTKQEYWGWGKGLGCSFTERCEKTWPSVRGAWCPVSNSDAICTLDRTAKGSCTVNTYSNALEAYYQHFSDPTRGGALSPSDYCPVVIGYSNRFCADDSNGETGNIYGRGSRCWPAGTSASALQSAPSAVCLRFNCISENEVQIEASPNTWTSCPSAGGTLNVGGTFYDCPPATLFCKSIADTNHAGTPAPPQVPPPAGEGDKKKSLCFIATAAYGSEMHPKVYKLRLFRDQVLSKYVLGRKFTEIYYQLSPPIANWIRTSEIARFVTRGLLWPVVAVVENFFG